LQFHFEVIQLNRLAWRNFVNKPNPVAAALMAKMNIAPRDRPRVKLECLRLLATLRLNQAKMRLISGFVDAYLRLTAKEQLEFQGEIKALSSAEKENVMEIVTSWMEDGLKQGRQEGRRQGLQQGRRQGLQQGRRQGLQQGRREGVEQGQLKASRDGVLEFLEARFNKVPVGVKATLKAIDDRKRLKLLLREAATATSLKEFQRRLAAVVQ
jgi:flagellar biosynthesis/type III secretory pathway protein FliH